MLDDANACHPGPDEVKLFESWLLGKPSLVKTEYSLLRQLIQYRLRSCPCQPAASYKPSCCARQVYVVYFKTNRNFIHEFPNMSNYVKDLYSNPGAFLSLRGCSSRGRVVVHWNR